MQNISIYKMKISIIQNLLLLAIFKISVSESKITFPIAPKIVLYDGVNQTGESLVVRANYFPKLQERVQSVCLNGTWLLYENENFNREKAGGVEYFSGDSFCTNLHSLRNQTSSLRFGGSSLDIAIDSITFYSHPYFQGMEEYFTESSATLDILKNETRSLIVTGHSDWRLYDQQDFKGDSFCVNPNATSESSGKSLMITDTNFIYIPHGSVRSLKFGCDEFTDFEKAPM